MSANPYRFAALLEDEAGLTLISQTHSDPAAAGYRRDVRRVLARIAAHRRRGRSVRQQRDLLHAGHPRTHQRCRAGLFHLYNNLWEYASVDEAIQIVLAVVLSTLVGAVFLWIIDVRLPIRVFFVSCFVLIFFMGGIRLIFRHAPEKARARPHAARVRPAAHAGGGRGETGSLAIGRMASGPPFAPGIPIVPTTTLKRGSRIHGG